MTFTKNRLTVSVACGIALTTLLALQSGCSKRGMDAHVMARVGDVEITEEEFKHEVDYRRSMATPVPAKEVILGDLINKKALLLKAKAAGLDKDAEIQRTVEDLIVSKLKEKELAERLRSGQVSDAEIEARYQKEIQNYTRPGKARLALLFLSTPRLATEQQRADIKARIEQAHDLASKLPADSRGFGALAIDYSEDQASRYRGGDIGWYDEGEKMRWPDDVVKAGFNLKPGEISDVIQTSKGFFVVMKMDSRPSSVTPLKEVADTIKRHLLNEKREGIEQSYLADSRRNLVIETNETLLQSIPLSNEVFAGKQSGPPALP